MEKKNNQNKIFNFKAEFGWSEVIALIALIGAGISLIIQINSNNPDLSLKNTSLVGTTFIDKNGDKYHFGFYRTTIINNGEKSVTLLGLKPHENSGLISTTERGSNKLTEGLIQYKIFQIPDSILVDHLIKGQLLISEFENQGLEKLSMINKVIGPGEIFTLNIGVIYDFYSDNSKDYSSFIFSSQLEFSNEEKFNFGTAGDI
ncbi:hypothetical protein QVZ41_13820 [Wenyingzhuangia sp. chi5]|uniref:Uncharacterized protein n=1 Tax=Wenyingzhuangia gilva TaxID=3057677 RepID=A0ABT8VVC8_9FLAO|nr:hypothetical protein [Wenyingzhuangia sp. chi5]MDO3695924.1 hypothetical protein [Wenyingzhuangia sp. chi5]